jgi:hypothetical protein
VERTSQSDIVVVCRRLDSLHGSTNVKLLGGLVEIRHSGVSHVIGAHDFFSFKGFIRSIDIGY